MLWPEPHGVIAVNPSRTNLVTIVECVNRLARLVAGVPFD